MMDSEHLGERRRAALEFAHNYKGNASTPESVTEFAERCIEFIGENNIENAIAALQHASRGLTSPRHPDTAKARDNQLFESAQTYLAYFKK